MRPKNSLETLLVADVGGTNTRIALFDPARQDYRALTTFNNRDYACFEDLVAHWLDSLEEAPPGRGCIAVAAPPAADRVVMINRDWAFSCRELAARFGFAQLAWINDFESNAYALPHLAPGDREVLHVGQNNGSGRLATIGPGTGLGGATLDCRGGSPRACASEPGHMGLAAATELELELFRLLLPSHGEVHAELLVSGPGLQRLYGALGEIGDEPVDALTPAQIAELAVQKKDLVCVQALETFCALLGSVCGDFVLANGAYQGLYLAGGIIPRMLPFLRASTFVQRMQQKGSMSEHLRAVPVYAITHPHPGLVGAAYAPV